MAALVAPFAHRLLHACADGARPPDLLDLYGILAEAGVDLAAAARTLYDAHRNDTRAPEAALASARSAVARVLRALAEYDSGRTDP